MCGAFWVLFLEYSVNLLFIRTITVNGGYLEPLCFRQFRLLPFELIVVGFGHRDGGHREHGVEAVQSLFCLMFKNLSPFLGACHLMNIIQDAERIV